jgi:threonine dehydrogenase-like Zn-dependent dehydrogenase
MIAAVLKKPGCVALIKTATPDISDHEVRIRIEGCGICASSIPLWQGREWFEYPQAPGAPGHEAWGTIDAVGALVKAFKSGDRVAFLSANGYAEYDIANEEVMVKLPEALASKPFPGEPLGCAMNIFSRSDITKNDTVAIIGIGFLGALLCQLAKHAGANVIAISRRNYSLGIAENYGADLCIPMTAPWEVLEKVKAFTGKNLCTRVIEATGKQEALDIATEIIGERGQLIVAGFHQDGLRQVNFQKWNWKGIEVINAHERAPAKYVDGMKKAVTAVVSGILQPEALYTDILSLDALDVGFQKTIDRPDGFMKAFIHL